MGLLIVGLTLVVGTAVLFVLLPVLRGDWAAMGRSDDEVTEVDARKQAALRGLRDAEYDYRSGKIDQEDYQVLKSDLARQALEAMEEEHGEGHITGEGPPPEAAANPSESSTPGPAADRLEAEIRERIENNEVISPADYGDEMFREYAAGYDVADLLGSEYGLNAEHSAMLHAAREAGIPASQVRATIARMIKDQQ